MLLLTLMAPAAFAACPPPPTSAEIGVKRIVDGDTLVLADGRHLRFIGINAMELGHGQGPDQPTAVAARDRLKQLVESHGGMLRLESGPEFYDEHGRTLAYVFAGGEDLGLDLIREGLAVVVAVPPDIGRIGCYVGIEAQARAAHLGIWSKGSPLFTAAAAADLTPGAFLIVHGQVTSVSPKRAGVHLMVDGHLPLWVPAEDLPRFDMDLRTLQGRQVLVRGWVRSYRGAPELDIHAPAALQTYP